MNDVFWTINEIKEKIKYFNGWFAKEKWFKIYTIFFLLDLAFLMKLFLIQLISIYPLNLVILNAKD